jgi:hypothetical protein
MKKLKNKTIVTTIALIALIVAVGTMTINMNRSTSAQTDNSCPDGSQPDSNGNCPPPQGSSDNSGGGSSAQGNSGAGECGPICHALIKYGCTAITHSPICLALQARAGR